MLPALFALEIWTFSMSPSYLAVTCTSTQFEVVCCAACCGIFPTPSTWTLSPSDADAASHPRCWATRIRGQCTSTRPLDYCTLHCSTNTQHVEIHTVNESVRNNSSNNNNTPPDKEGMERSTMFFWTIDKRNLYHWRVQVGHANVHQRSLSGHRQSCSVAHL